VIFISANIASTAAKRPAVVSRVKGNLKDGLVDFSIAAQRVTRHKFDHPLLVTQIDHDVCKQRLQRSIKNDLYFITIIVACGHKVSPSPWEGSLQRY